MGIPTLCNCILKKNSYQIIIFSLSLKGVAIMQFQNPPVNSLSLDFLTEFAINLEKLELDRSCRGMIITSVSHQKHLL